MVSTENESSTQGNKKMWSIKLDSYILLLVPESTSLSTWFEQMVSPTNQIVGEIMKISPECFMEIRTYFLLQTMVICFGVDHTTHWGLLSSRHILTNS